MSSFLHTHPNLNFYKTGYFTKLKLEHFKSKIYEKISKTVQKRSCKKFMVTYPPSVRISPYLNDHPIPSLPHSKT